MKNEMRSEIVYLLVVWLCCFLVHVPSVWTSLAFLSPYSSSFSLQWHNQFWQSLEKVSESDDRSVARKHEAPVRPG